MSKCIAILTVLCCALVMPGVAQEKIDTVIVELANSSKVVFTMKDRSDLDILKNYDFQSLFRDILAKLETNDSTAVAKEEPTEERRDEEEVSNEEEERWSRYNDDDDDDDEGDNDDNGDDDTEWTVHTHGGRWGRTWQSFNFDLGTNNYLSDGKFPDSDNAAYAVRPWGSWYLAVNSIQRTRVARKFFVEWGVGLSWYTFKFQEDNVAIQKGNDEVSFVYDAQHDEYIKSKLGASFVNVSLVPVLDFGGRGRKSRLWDGHSNAFRIGAGGYAGYRISSRSKIVYKDGSGREKFKDKDNFYLNNFRYGLRVQLGFRSTDLFFNYDLNELFSEGKGPSLNAFSFGVIL